MIQRFKCVPTNIWKIAAHLSSDLANMVQWGKDWLVIFSTAKIKVITLHHDWADLDGHISMDGILSRKLLYLERLLGLKLSPGLMWNSHILSIAKNAGLVQCTTPVSIWLLLLYTILLIRRKMEKCFHVWVKATQSSLACLDRVQTHLRGSVGDELLSAVKPLSLRQNVANLSLLYRYFCGMCYEKLYSLFLPPDCPLQVNSLCHVHKSESSSFPSYSYRKE